MFFESIRKFVNGFLKADSLKQRLSRRTARLVLDRLEDRLCPTAYPYDVMAVTGTSSYSTAGVSAVGTLSNVSDASINNTGTVAFLGTINGHDTVDESTGPSANLTVLGGFSTPNLNSPQIDDNGNVIAQDQVSTPVLGLKTNIGLWQPSGVELNVDTGFSAAGDIFVLPTISPNETQFAYLDDFSSTQQLFINGIPGPTFPSGHAGIQPRIANNGGVVVQAGNTSTSPIMVFFQDGTSETIADTTTMGFTALGSHPGISADGQVVVFYGEVPDDGGSLASQLLPGPP